LPHVCVAVVGFVLPLLFLIPWILQHPGAYADQVRRYQLYDPKQVSAARGLSRLLSFASLTQRSEIYWQSFNPSFLFFSGDSSLTNATRQAGIFLLPVAVFLAVGIVRLLNRRLPRFNLVILFGFLSARGCPGWRDLCKPATGDGREDLLQRTTYFEAAKLLVQTMPARSILLSRVGEATVETLTKTGQLRKVDVVKEPDNTASFAIYER